MRVIPRCRLRPDLGQPCASVYHGTAASPQWGEKEGSLSRAGSGSKVTPKAAAGALQGRATDPSRISPISPCPAGLSLQGRANAARAPRSCRRRFLRMRGEIRMRRKARPSLIEGNTHPAAPPGPAPAFAFSQREFPPPGQRLRRTAASPSSPAAAAALGEVTAEPAERLRKEDAPGAPGSPRQRGMREGIASAPPQREALGPRTGSGEKTRTRKQPQFALLTPSPAPSRDAMPPPHPRCAHPSRSMRIPPAASATPGERGGGTRRGGTADPGAPLPGSPRRRTPPAPRPRTHLGRAARGRRAHLLPKRPHTKS